VAVQVIDTNVQVDFGDRFLAEADVDVKPGSDINPLNLRSKGVLPVAILGSEELDVTLIDPASLLLNGVAALRWSYEDVWGSGEMPDGYEDLTLKFSTQDIAASLGNVSRGDFVVLTLEGTLIDGTPIIGEEMVWIVQVP
jgi:hypothetical protein